MLAWEAESGKPLTPDRHLAGQALPGGARPAGGRWPRGRDEGGAAACRSTPTSRPARSPGCSSTTRRSRVRETGATSGSGPSTRSSATASAPAFATDPSTASRTQLGAPEWDQTLLDIFDIPRDALPEIADTAGDLGTLRHQSWPVELPLRARCVDQQAALAGAGCVGPGRTKATYGTGVFVLANVGAERPVPRGGLLPTVAWQVGGEVEWALDGGVFTAGALLDWLSRDLGLAADTPALARLAREVDDTGGVRVLPALAGIGAPWWRPSARAVIAGLTSGARPAHVARAALESIAWRVADVVEAISEQAPVDVLRVDGGLTRDPLLLQLQADARGRPGRARGSRRHRDGCGGPCCCWRGSLANNSGDRRTHTDRRPIRGPPGRRLEGLCARALARVRAACSGALSRAPVRLVGNQLGNTRSASSRNWMTQVSSETRANKRRSRTAASTRKPATRNGKEGSSARVRLRAYVYSVAMTTAASLHSA